MMRKTGLFHLLEPSNTIYCGISKPVSYSNVHCKVNWSDTSVSQAVLKGHAHRVPISLRRHYTKGRFMLACVCEDLRSPAFAMRMKQFTTWEGTDMRVYVIMLFTTRRDSGGSVWKMVP